MLDAQGREVRVGREISGRAQATEQVEEDLGMTLAGVEDEDLGLTEPRSAGRGRMMAARSSRTLGPRRTMPRDPNDRTNAAPHPASEVPR